MSVIQHVTTLLNKFREGGTPVTPEAHYLHPDSDLYGLFSWFNPQ
jgi:hypothetical protein